MSDLRRSFERSAARFRPPDDWFGRIEQRRRQRRRNQRIVPVLVLSMFAVFAAGLVTLRTDRPLPPGTPTSSSARVVYRDTFGSVSSGWPTRLLSRFSFRYVEGQYEIEASRPFDQRYWIRRVLDPLPRIDVRVQVASVGSGTSGWAGVMCPFSVSPDDGYALVVSGTDSAWRIIEVVEGQPPNTLAEGSMGSLGTGSNTVSGHCVILGQGGAELTIQVGSETASVVDETGPTGFVGIGMYVLAGADQAIARFDDLTLEVP